MYVVTQPRAQGDSRVVLSTDLLAGYEWKVLTTLIFIQFGTSYPRESTHSSPTSFYH